jgi:hypothetical protein
MSCGGVLLSCRGEVYAPSRASRMFQRPNGPQQMLMQKRDDGRQSGGRGFAKNVFAVSSQRPLRRKAASMSCGGRLDCGRVLSFRAR